MSTPLPLGPSRTRVAASVADTGLDERGWNALAARGTYSVFQTWQWHQAWWSTFGAAYEPLFLTVGGDGPAAGVAPLFVERSASRGRVVRFVGEGRADYCDLLTGGDWNTVAAIVRGLKDYGRWDVVDLGNIPSRSTTIGMLEAIGHDAGLNVLVHDHLVCPTLLVRGHETAARRIADKSSLRRRQHYFERRGRLSFRDMRTSADVQPYLDTFFAQHVERWRTTDTPSLFTDPANRRFYADLAGRLDGTGWLFFSAVELDDRPIALHYGFDFDDALVWYKPSFDPQMAAGSPGLVLVRHLIQRAVDGGRRELDFTIGDEPFKQRFTNFQRHTVRIQLFRDPARYVFERSRRGVIQAVRKAAAKVRNQL
ncbi:MAG: GNAT family N-acetyltransferase [Vicinamibacterales bacterium]